MKRRNLLKAIGLLGTSLAAPTLVMKNGVIRKAGASSINISDRALREAKAFIQGEVIYVVPASLPTVLNIFMYGGPSELAGNLTNIVDINRDSQNGYPNGLNADAANASDNLVANGGQVTANGFWQNAGGAAMERMLAANQMSIYRTINRIVDDTKAHRTSIFSAQVGGLDQFAPGVGTTLAAVLRAFQPGTFNDPGATPVIPFASFEGDTVLFNPGDINDLPLWLRSVSLDSNFNNPYTRRRNYNNFSTSSICDIGPNVDISCSDALDDLAQRSTNSNTTRFKTLGDSFEKRRELDAFFTGQLKGDPNLKIADDNLNPGTPVAVFNGRFGDNLVAACVLALENPDTRFMTLSTGGLGGWDDHDNAMANNRYINRMNELMNNLEQAMQLLAAGTRVVDAAGNQGANKNNGRTDVIINVYGEFGRNVNLNNSMGWDHGNNMNLYTFGGSTVPGRVLGGPPIGTTKVIGTPGQNRLFTSPAGGSVQYEPMSIAATVYKHFGVNNPEVLTKDTVMAPLGFPAIPGA